MIEFLYKISFELHPENKFKRWIKNIVGSEDKIIGDISYIFCDDQALDKLNQEYLDHKDYTDIISFDDTIGDIISGEIFISVERVEENAAIFGIGFEEELLRVMSHGILHFCGYKDGSDSETKEMREKENQKIKMFHVEHSTKNDEE